MIDSKRTILTGIFTAVKRSVADPPVNIFFSLHNIEKKTFSAKLFLTPKLLNYVEKIIEMKQA